MNIHDIERRIALRKGALLAAIVEDDFISNLARSRAMGAKHELDALEEWIESELEKEVTQSTKGGK